MAKERTGRALLLEKLREQKDKVKRLKKCVRDDQTLLSKLDAMLKFHSFPVKMTALKASIEQLKTARRVRLAQHNLADAEKNVLAMGHQLVLMNADAEIRKGVDGGLAAVEPGWRWVRGWEGHYVWDDRGRVGSLKTSLFPGLWVIILIQPTPAGRYHLSLLSGKFQRQSFSTIASEACGDPLVLAHSPDGDSAVALLDNNKKVVIRESPFRLSVR